MKSRFLPLGFFILALSFYGTQGLSENLLNVISGYKESIDIFGIQYRAFLASARREMHSTIVQYNARVISRIGFVSEDMKDLDNVVRQEIDDRASLIGSDNAECITNARRRLEEANTNAGNSIMSSARRTIDDLNILNEIAVYPRLDEIEVLVYLFEVEILVVFGYYNSVTNFFQLILMLESEVRTYGALFEYYVSEIYVEMVIHQMLTDDISAAVFPKLEYGLNAFIATVDEIRVSLLSC